MKQKIIASSPEDKEWVMEQLIAFNRKFLPSTPEKKDLIPLNFHILSQDKMIIAGINSIMLYKSTVKIDILWVEEEHRGHDYGSQLLGHVETEAKKSGAALIHLDTFDFQAREFYAKCGYEEFAVLENSPAMGNKRFYMRKIL
ncbi:MAG: GNAT family N-acetyltransferase [Proteobacteria bacterium]|nr:GNAT family N-acetyltransferase [Pseudomonadota bacterium]